MDFETYRREGERLYHEFLRLWQEAGGEFPSKLPGLWRPHWEKFELIVDLTENKETLLCEIEELKEKILSRRTEVLNHLGATRRLAVVVKFPGRKDEKRIRPADVIKKAQTALDVYRLRNNPRLSIACSVFGFRVSADDKKSETAEKKVRQYLAHAETLLNAAGNSCFLEALTKPLPKNC